MSRTFGGPIRLLVVEDDPADLAWLELMLSQANIAEYSIVTADNVRSALMVIGGGGLDCVLLDLSLPDSEGLESLRQVHTCDPDLPVVVLSGMADVDLGRAAIAAGAQDYLVKGQTTGNQVLRAALWAVNRRVSPTDRQSGVLASTGPGLDVRAPHAVLDRSARIVSANPALLDLLGLGRDDVLGASFTAFVDPSEVGRISDGFADLREGTTPAFTRGIACLHPGTDPVAVFLLATALDEPDAGVDGFLVFLAPREPIAVEGKRATRSPNARIQQDWRVRVDI